MQKLAQIEQTLPLIGNMLLPAFIFAAALLGFYYSGAFSSTTTHILHIGIYLLSVGCTLAQIYFNRSKLLFAFFIVLLAYTLINLFKHLNPETYFAMPAYISLSTLIPLNLLLFYFLPPRPLFSKINLRLLLIVFLQYAAAELLARQNTALGVPVTEFLPTLNWAALGGFMLLCGIILVNAVRTGSISNYHCFFASLSLMLAFYYSPTASGLTIFTFAAVLCLLSALAQTTYNDIYKDPLTQLNSRNSFIIHSKNLPFKYSIGIVSIDDYDKLRDNFGRRAQNVLTKLIAERISELEKDELIYRYGADEFVIVFKTADRNESFERLETIRRAVASASFEYRPRRKPLKLTVSAAVSEKKRSDANAVEVLIRAAKVLQKTRAFSHNVTSKA